MKKLNFYERLNAKTDLIVELSKHSHFLMRFSSLLTFLMFNGYEPEVVSDGPDSLPMFRFSYKGEVVLIYPSYFYYDRGKQISSECIYVNDKYFSDPHDVKNYLPKAFPVIQSKSDAIQREIDILNAKHKAEFIEEMRKDYAEDPTSVPPHLVEEYSLDPAPKKGKARSEELKQIVKQVISRKVEYTINNHKTMIKNKTETEFPSGFELLLHIFSCVKSFLPRVSPLSKEKWFTAEFIKNEIVFLLTEHGHWDKESTLKLANIS